MKYLFLFFISLKIFADCSSQNLITEPNSPFNNIPVYNQEDSRICYAYTAAQMMDYHLIKNGAKDRSIHPLWAALTINKRIDQPSLPTGSTALTINSMRHASNCDYAQVVEAVKEWTKISGMSENELISFLDLFYENIQKAKKKKSFFKRNKLTEEELDQIYADSVGTQMLNSCIQLEEWVSLYAQIKLLASLTPTEIFSSILEKKCLNGEKLKNKTPKAVDIFKKRNKSLADEINSYLTQTHEPIGINYCTNFWQTPNYQGYLNNKLSKDCLMHASIIVGQKEVNQQCQYLIRDTAGSEWNDNNSQWKCLCKNKVTSEFVDDCTHETHSNLLYRVEACWVPEKIINNNTHSLTKFKTSSPVPENTEQDRFQ
ncbi:MAG: hypothetical protein AB7I27_06600 [Bacteriovoracaceae bacterium]